MEALQHKNIGLDTLFDFSPDLLCLTDEHGYFLKVNKYLRQALGYREDEMLSKHFLDFIHPEDRENSLRQWKALSENQSIFLFKNRYRCASGLYKSFSWNAAQLPDKTYYATAREITKYIKIQSQLAKALTDNKKIYNNSLDVLCSFNAEGQFTRVSKAAKTIWGYEEQELLGKCYLNFVHPDDIALTVATEQEIKLGSHKTNFENRFIHKNGSIVPVIWSAQWLPLEQTLFATARDASEREKQKEQLQFKERRLEALIKSGNDLIGILSAEGIYQYVSPSVDNILNLAPEDFIGKTPFDFIHPDDVVRVKNAFEYILTTADTVHVCPFRIVNGNGNWNWVETFATNLLNDPAIGGVVVNSRDVSIKIKDEQEKQLVAKQLSESIGRYKLVTEVTKDVIWDWNFETNQLSRELGLENFGYAEDLPWENYIHPDDKERILKSIRSAVENPNEKFWKEEYRFIKADGTVAYIIDKGCIVRNADKKVLRMVGAMHDNTELKEKELHNLKQNERLREIAQINSHVIRRPVATILGLMDLLDKESVCGPENQEILQYLEISTKELDRVIKSINDRVID